jgi:hypothetical protein
VFVVDINAVVLSADSATSKQATKNILINEEIKKLVSMFYFKNKNKTNFNILNMTGFVK